jgi:hypothetical protein
MGPLSRKHKKPFSPWKTEFRVAAVYCIAGAVWFAAALLWCVREPTLISKAAAEAAVLPFFVGLLRSDSARKRKFGHQVEKKWAAKLAAAVPPDWTVDPDVEVERVGNIDALVYFANGRRCPVEIKSWRNSRYHIRFNAALRQARRQRDVLLAQNAVLWLPEAKIRNAGYQRDIVIVQGDEQFLIECLRKLKYRFVVQFPNPPPWQVREQLRSLGFHFNRRGLCWEGRCREAAIHPLRRDVSAAGGTIRMP